MKPAVRNLLLLVALAAGTAYLFCLPRDLFKGARYSTVVTDRNGELLGARIAADGQWRFPVTDTVPEKFRTALVTFEDRWFYVHPGVNPVSIVRAAAGNLKAGRITGGGSTLTMQVIRMSRRKERTLWQKMIEAVLATRLELRSSKDEILALYAAHAPFGGNVVGLEAAAWRYFGRPADELSWSEAALLAVLPNAPAEIHPGKNRALLQAKRNRLLVRLRERGAIDSLDCALACEEPVPPRPVPLPDDARQLVEWYGKRFPGQRVRTDIDLHLQRQVQAATDVWSREFARSGTNDLAAVVVDVRSGEVLAYVGNADASRVRPGSDVDIVRAPRSTGSILKPFLYGALLQEGDILPRTLLPDIPVNINGFSPQNFNLQFAGAVPADEALARSLNVPAVHMLRKYGVPRFLELLRGCGLTTLGRSASDYGLSLILGGGEGTLLDITSAYAAMAASYLQETPAEKGSRLERFPLKDKCALWYVFDALKDVNRPEEVDLRMIRSVRNIAWKTGTSYGFRDAWAVGVTADYAVGVWAGNAQGQGVPGLTGAQTAGPVLFDLFGLLPAGTHPDGRYSEGGWFLRPLPDDGVRAEVCPVSGHLKGIDCERADTLLLPRKSVRTDACPYHKTLDGIRTFQLPPSMEWYYRQLHPEYTPYVPKDRSSWEPMEFIYPENGSTLYLPRQLDGSVGGITFHLAHRTQDAEVFWHLDDTYVGTTRLIHQMNLAPAPGTHTVTAVDGDGNAVSVRFTVAAGS